MSDIRNFDLNLLVVFEALLNEQNVTRAAEKLGVSQAAVSASLKRLRTAYGTPLFVRGQRGLKPTAQAILLQPMIEDALSLVRKTIDSPDSSVPSSAKQEIVAIGTSDDFEIAYGLQLIEALHAALPHVRPVFRQTNSSVVAEALHEGAIDIALTSGGVKDNRIRSQSLGSSGYLCLFDLSRRKHDEPLSLDEYLSREHILVSFSGLTGIVDEVLSEHDHRRQIRAATSHFSMLQYLLAGTDAVATLPSHAARAIARTTALGLSPCPVSFPRYNIDLSWRFDALRRKNIKRVRDQIVQVFSLAASQS